ncbi:LysR family transcriptional regulator [Pleionea litopenaei]|uniref:LysR family transcriptional regulator n=1 Tax=Pleionea litopenaei TaxID=3070815 RepID=A0AA51X5U9_9GAMM|nr:LysR family transcriptional regulator [Pleionea sp. HL-JVS1]WMS86111.1 LysR family transcriptional regulator [Pleionea sp. HL-JVS1]
MSATPKITLEQWASFVAVVDEGSYAKAAELLNKSQSTVSYAISRLEEHLGGQVLKLNGRKAELTDLGEVMVRKARKLLDEADGIEQLAACVSRGWESEVVIAVDVVYPVSDVLEAIEVFNERGEKATRIRFLETSLSGTDEALFQGTADLVIAPRVPPGFIGEQLDSVEFIAVAHKEHPLNQLDRAVTLEELAQTRQVVMRDTGIKRQQDAGWLGSEQRITVSHFSTSVEVIRRKMAFAWLPSGYIQKELASGEFKPLNLEQGQRRTLSLFLINARGERAGPGVKLMMNIFLERVKKK